MITYQDLKRTTTNWTNNNEQGRDIRPAVAVGIAQSDLLGKWSTDDVSSVPISPIRPDPFTEQFATSMNADCSDVGKSASRKRFTLFSATSAFLRDLSVQTCGSAVTSLPL